MKIEFWDSENQGAESKLIRVEEWEDNEESFAKYYKLNNRYKYCNGTYYKFVDKKDAERYENDFFPKHNTIDNYYGNGTVD